MLINQNQKKQAEIPWRRNDEGGLGKINRHGHMKGKRDRGRQIAIYLEIFLE